jgi:hypothetical protein
LHLREALGAIFSNSGLEGEDVWRAAARVRALLAHNGRPLAEVAASRSFWSDADVRWLVGVNESEGKTYFNQEAFDELLAWMALPSLLTAAANPDPAVSLRRIEDELLAAREDAKAAGFELERFLGRPVTAKPTPESRTETGKTSPISGAGKNGTEAKTRAAGTVKSKSAK